MMPNINLSDPELELIDPTPNVHSLFIHFDKEFFWTKLASRSAVRWSKRMYSCAGTCSFDRVYCDIALSEPLLKLRPRKDLVETLLHEMIHAFLFITNSDRDRDGHGPNFQAHMHRINKAACLNISIYHDFHDEVKLYQTHWWRCDGPCVKTRPHFGIVRRTANRPPGPYDYWWERHKQLCGGSFVKIKEPEKKVKSKASKGKKDSKAKPMGDITKFITNKDQSNKPRCPKNDMSNSITTGVKKSNTVVSSPKGFSNINSLSTPSPEKVRSITVFSGAGHSISSTPKHSGKDAAETVRNVWANKQLPTVWSKITNNPTNKRKSIDINKSNPGLNNSFENKRHGSLTDVKSPPIKMKKIDDYFHRANSIIQELYGDNYELVKSDNSDKIIAINKEDTIKEEKTLDLAPCPVCNLKVPKADINKHLDECLNKGILKELSKSQEDETISASNSQTSSPDDKNINIHHVNNMKIDLGNIVDYLIKKGDIDANLSEDSKGSVATAVSSSDIIIKQEPGTSKDFVQRQKCACCGKIVAKSIEEHLDECLAFFDNNVTTPEKGASTSIIIIEDDDDDLDDSQTMNDTGTKFPCPSCLLMIEETDMNSHLDSCLS